METDPLEVIAAPFTLYLAAVGTAFPDPADAPNGSWTKIGTSGDRNYNSEGVKVRHEETVEFFKPLGATGPTKAGRTDEMLRISLLLHDLTLEQYAIALNHNTVSETNAMKVGLSRGRTVTRKALLVRGPSPYDASLNAQYEVPIAVQVASQEVTFSKNIQSPAGLALEFVALEDPDASDDSERFGRFVADDGVT